MCKLLERQTLRGTPIRLAAQRLRSQRIGHAPFATPVEAVRWFGAVQAQDYLGSLWALGLRTRGATQTRIERAIEERAIVRTWPMRGTLHFVAAQDVRWILELLGPRVLARNVRRLEKDHGINAALVARSRKVLERAMGGGRHLTRPELYSELEHAGIATGNSRGLHLMWWHAHEGLVCVGPRAGKQPTFVLLEEWLASTRKKSREDSLAELARRYFASHGPATVQDFAWWSGLTVADAAAGLEMVAASLLATTVDGQTYWLTPSRAARKSSRSCHLLPAFDEYTVAYSDRSAALSSAYAAHAPSSFDILNPAILIEGEIVGNWSRELQQDCVVITPRLSRKLSRSEEQALTAAAQRYAKFLELPNVEIRSRATARVARRSR